MTSERMLAMKDAIAEATVQAMEDDPGVFVMGVGVDDVNGIFGTTKLPFERFGKEGRVFDTPLSEPTLTGMGVGAAMLGMRPILVHARCDFLLETMDQIVNHAAKWSYMSGGALRTPLVIRAVIGRGWGQAAQHSQSLQATFAHFPGLQVVMPADAYGAKGLLLSALRGNQPVVYLEHRWLHNMQAPVPEGRYAVPIGKGDVVRSGKDLTIVAVSHMVVEAKKAAATLASEGIEATVIDLRSIRPWDADLVCGSVSETGRLLVADTGGTSFGVSAEIVATVAERAWGKLKAAPARIGLPDCPTPCAPNLEAAFYPGPEAIVAAAHRLVSSAVSAPSHASEGSEDKPFNGHF